MNLITKTFNHLKNRYINHQELKSAQCRLVNKVDVWFKKDIDLVINHYQKKITERYQNDIQNREPILYFIKGDKIKITQSDLKNNLREITKILAYLKNSNTYDARKIDYLAGNFSKNALNILKNTLDTDIHTQLKPKEYNHFGIIHAVFEGDATKISKIKALIDLGLYFKENGGKALRNNNVPREKPNWNNPVEMIPVQQSSNDKTHDNKNVPRDIFIDDKSDISSLSSLNISKSHDYHRFKC
jgi:hypothetical protein